MSLCRTRQLLSLASRDAVFSAPRIPMQKEGSHPPPSRRLPPCIPAAPGPSRTAAFTLRRAAARPAALWPLCAAFPAFPATLWINPIHPLGSWEHPRHLLPRRLLNFTVSQKNKSCLQSWGGRGDKSCQRQACFSPSLYFDSCCRRDNSLAASKVAADGGFASSLGHHIISPGFSQLLKLIFEQPGSPSGHCSLNPPLAACFLMGLG